MAEIGDSKGKRRAPDEPVMAPLTEDQKAMIPIIANDIEAGTRAYALGQWEDAITHFGHLSELTEQAFGNDSLRYADSLVMYGRALLQNAISQTDLIAQKVLTETIIPTNKSEKNEPVPNSKIVFSGEPDFDPEIVEPHDEEEGTEKAGDRMEEEEGGKVESKGSEEARIIELLTAEGPSTTAGTASTSGGEVDNVGDYFQSAWEVLDLARLIQKKDEGSVAGKKKLAETLLLLGDVSMETENFDIGALDYKEALELKRQVLDESSRELPELSFKVALALEYSGNKGEALEQLKDVQGLIQNIIRIYETTNEPELDNMKGLLAEVDEKVLDLQASIEASKNGSGSGSGSGQLPQEANGTGTEESLNRIAKGVITEAIKSGKVNDITGMVRSKKNKSATKESSSTTKAEPKPEHTDKEPDTSVGEKRGNDDAAEGTEKKQKGKGGGLEVRGRFVVEDFDPVLDLFVDHEGDGLAGSDAEDAGSDALVEGGVAFVLGDIFSDIDD
ncbi:NASP-related protein sim3, partial [Smittium mucronatum]